MGRKSKLGKTRQDRFYRLAKEQGYRSRASFKLIQLNKRFDFLSSASRGVLDLCAAPGGWMQVARKQVPAGAPVIGIDLVPIRAIPGCVCLEADITSDKTHGELKRVLTGKRVDVVLNDGSPNMGAAWLQDAYTQSELTLAAVALSTKFLARGGAFVTKVFRSMDYTSLIFVMNQLFARVTPTKPSASRAESAEIYVVATGYKDPAYIDPKLLNPKYVFRELGGPETDSGEKKKDMVLSTALKMRATNRRSREGYPDAATNLFGEAHLDEFLRSETPVAMLARSNAILLPKEDHPLLSWPGTTEEVKASLSDTAQLGRREFKLLLRYRTLARAYLAIQASPCDQNETNSRGAKEAVNSEEEEAEALANEEAAALQALSAREKRKKKKERKRRAALQRKIDMEILSGSGNSEAGGTREEDLFDVRTALKVDSSKLKGITEDTEADVLADDDSDECYDPSKESEEKSGSGRAVLMDPEDIKKEELKRIESEADDWYQDYLSRRDPDRMGSTLEGKSEEIRQEEKSGKERPAVSNSEQLNPAKAEEKLDFAKEPLAGPRKTALWFSQEVFRKANIEGGNDLDRSEEEETAANGASDGTHVAAKRAADKQFQRETLKQRGDCNDFDVIPQEKPGESSDPDDDTVSFHSSDYDTDDKAEMVAIGREMRRSKKRRLELLDDAYNRYVFDDPETVPSWFADTESKFRERQPPVTKEQVAECKAYIKSLAMAPTKKEVEASARKKRRVQKKLNAVRRKAEKIAEQTGMTGNARIDAIDKLYQAASKASRSKQPAKNYVVVKPGGSYAARKSKHVRGGRTKLVDSRMKADTRGAQRKRKRKRKKGKR